MAEPCAKAAAAKGAAHVGIISFREKKFTELGGRVYHAVAVDKIDNVNEDTQVKLLVSEISDFEQKLNDKNAEIEKVKETKETERREREEAKKREKEEALKTKETIINVQPEEVEVQEVPAEEEKPKKKKKKDK